MKKLLILTATLLTGGLALPASAQHRGHYYSNQTEVYISGYLPCGSPIYSRRTVSHHGHADHRGTQYEYELRIQRERERCRQSEYLRQLEIRREIERRRYYNNSRRNHGYGYGQRCR